MVAGKAHLSAGDYKPIEALHWNPRGHRRMAAVLKELYESFRSGKLTVVSVGARQPGAEQSMSALYQSSPAGFR